MIQTTDLDLTGTPDEADERLHRTGPGLNDHLSPGLNDHLSPGLNDHLSNHGTMASEALVQPGPGEHVHPWLVGPS